MSNTIIDRQPEIIKSKILRALESNDLSVQFSDSLDNEMVLNMGPQHPATHGVLRLLLSLDGETVMKCVPELGYLHRGYEKLAEASTFHEFIPHTDRLDYLQPMANNVAYTLAVEKLIKLEIPDRAKYIRTIIAELARIQSHLLAIGALLMDVGAVTPFLWAIREREKILDLWDLICGARFTNTYTRIGGTAQDISEEIIDGIKKFIKEFYGNLKECRDLVERNKIFIIRTEGIGYLEPKAVIDIGLTGPLVRAAGIEQDLRKDDPYLIYDRLNFDIPVYDDSDALARYYVRVEEMIQSARIVEQCIEQIPAGPHNALNSKKVLPAKQKVYTKMEELINDFMIINFGINPPKGESYGAIESSKGELGFYIISDGSGYPFRMKIRSPSFSNLQGLPEMMKGCFISDTVVIIGSVDPVMGEADK
ncbi:NADH dehydrogenase (quinone) subunit D [Ignavibacteria bacterium CHB1]|nr:MAG: NADH dehydrogenase (quinone) subunit D [Chlorobiota bacterium]MBV6398334.1 NADH-quinone oxidoreductase subunit 4 [Ignavibacteria bacterium]MCC6886075.1 NADH dehydrogenase (quinone) subunit D [Ignavibacteriales bacterium]MCE7952673.1 NADH dehydrogenase (quinone) subunit D [Chlorobi bacterium CHB7]MDL1886785.1 NADH dehydrogenase (quinone) subunit D [Ignavibacteria bacterium CHB1]RIK50310.1 MAG: NADH-quinone oxidoreductase subunit D [Ignavibacteriota bacterium]